MPTRREFLEGVSAATLLSAYSEVAGRTILSGHLNPQPLFPSALKPGARVALIAPCSHLFEPDAYDRAAERIRTLGFVPALDPRARAVRGYLAGEDRDRANQIHDAFADPKIDAIWCLRGGYGALRVLPWLDMDLVRAHPKVFVGYSDVTAFHVAFQKFCGLVTFHGPMPSSDLSPFAVEELRRVAGTPAPAGQVGRLPPAETSPGRVDADRRILTIRGGTAQGPLTGGNLSLITRLLGTPFEPPFAGKILFLEDVGEAVYRIDGMLAQLRLSGKLAGCAGVVLGRFTDADGGGQPVKLPLETVFRDLLGDLGIPVFWGLAVGHVSEQTTLPYGVMAKLDADAGSLELMQPAVQ